MGEQKVRDTRDAEEQRRFTKALLANLRALERMLETGMIESGITRIGAEQEVFLVDSQWRPAMTAIEVLEQIDDSHFTTELGRFNIEYNLDPIRLGDDCLRRMEKQLTDLWARAVEGAAKVDTRVLMTGILPTLQKSDLTLDAMTPMERYYALNEAMNRLRGDQFDLRIKGRDELLIQHDNVMLEACNTSFQVHFQVSHENFARRYNIAQAVAAPVLAAATNSPLLFGRQLWRETRIALFQQSIDTRRPLDHLREVSPRVSFGRSWVENSALEVFQEDMARFRVILATEIDEDPFAAIDAGRAPKLKALCLHNGTVYRWNRACYGISEGKPHLRIENRVLPAGPTPLDEMANAAFWFGLLSGVAESYGDITEEMEFAQAHENFVAAARLGLGAHFDWPGHDHVPAQRLILDQLLPLARDGLAELGIDGADIDRYLGVIEERVRSLQTGSQWQLDSLDAMRYTHSRSRDECLVALVAGLANRQRDGEPVHRWKLASLEEAGDFQQHYQRVEQVMTTDLFTVNQDELVDMAAYVMNWKHIRHVPVEDDQHRLVGLVTHRSLLRLVAENLASADRPATPVSEIMQHQVITVAPRTPSLEALSLMRKHKISCLPVVEADNRLVGIVTERDFMGIAGELLDQFLKESGEP